MPITFYTADIKFSLKQKRKLKDFIHHQITKSSNQLISLSFIFCSDEYLRAINKKFLNHDYYTDIITFPFSEDRKHIEAEVYISVERVQENARKYALHSSSPFQGEGARRVDEVELLRVMFHGVLHLLGHKDKTKAQKAEMRKLENKWLDKFKAQK